MNRREFLHYYYYHSLGHPESMYLKQLPKKLETPLIDPHRQGDVHGWGIHIIEGPNRVLITWCCVGILIASFVTSLAFAIIMKTQEEGFGIGQWMVAVLATTMTAFYFQWEEE